jgi:hypothetical protein
MSQRLEEVRKLVVGEFGAGLCQCGCGQPTRLATVRDARTYGVEIGTPLAYAPNHGKRRCGDLVITGEGGDVGSRCWLWTGSAQTNDNVPRRANGRPAGENLRRLVYGRFVGPLVPRSLVKAVCGHPRCLNPDHLVTVRDGRAFAELKALGGVCRCGCGGRTEIAAETDASRGLITGMPRPYVRGHQARGNRDFVVEVDAGFPTPCHEHQGRQESNGYVTGPRGYAHRAVFADAGVVIRRGWTVHHRCHNPRCCNPSHLALVPEAQNIGRGIGRPVDKAVEEIRRRYPSRAFKRRGDVFAVCDLGYATPCWVWLRNRTSNGYPVRSYTREERRRRPSERPEQYAHRYLWTDRYGPIPSGLQLDHLCNVRLCVNPEHMELVTNAENHARRARRNLEEECRHWEEEEGER